MNQSRVGSPEAGLKKPRTASSPKLSKSRAYLPSRYVQDPRPEKSGFHDILNSIECKTRQESQEPSKEISSKIKLKTAANTETEQTKKQKNFQFKARPLKREESDQQNFNEIFLNPRQAALNELQKTIKTQENAKTITKEYEKLLKFEAGESTLEEAKKEATEQVKMPTYAEHVQMLQSANLFGLHIETVEVDFYDNPISIDPPDFPGTGNSVGINSATYAPSVPSNLKGLKDSNIKELLMRAKAGMNTDDIEKEAHLSYYLGEVYSQKKLFKESLKFFRRFLGFAKAMEDRIGMSLGANRVAIAYFNCGDIQKSIVFHNENLKLSDAENCFIGFYNIGICYRKLNRLQEALEYFESAYNWAHERAEEDSQCISLGQIAVTFQQMELYQEAIQKFESSMVFCENLKKEELKMHNLRYILRISSQFDLKPIQTLQEIAEQAFECSKVCSSMGMQDILRCNIGILRGMEEFSSNAATQGEADQIQQDVSEQ